MVGEVGAAFGRLDFLVHFIAYAPPTSFEQRFVDIARADFALALEKHCFATEDHKEAIRAFVEKRKPNFTGR